MEACGRFGVFVVPFSVAEMLRADSRGSYSELILLGAMPSSSLGMSSGLGEYSGCLPMVRHLAGFLLRIGSCFGMLNEDVSLAPGSLPPLSPPRPSVAPSCDDHAQNNLGAGVMPSSASACLAGSRCPSMVWVVLPWVVRFVLKMERFLFSGFASRRRQRNGTDCLGVCAGVRGSYSEWGPAAV